MKVIIKSSVAKGIINAPPSKSMAHRALICGALSGGSVISNIAYSKDISATLDCLEKLGASVEKVGDTVKIGGLNPYKITDGTQLFCDESGSTLRFFIPMCAMANSEVTLSGSERLFERPLTVYEDICKRQEIFFNKKESSVTVCGRLSPGDYSVPGNISSQFITGLLLVCPLLDGDSTLTVTGRFESASYIDLTLNAMEEFGVEVKRVDNVFYIKGGQCYESRKYRVEGDCSNAAFLDGFNMVGGDVRVNGILPDTKQGDRVYLDMYRGLDSGRRSYDLSDCPDLAPVMFAVAAYKGGAEFTGTARLKIKESDRASVMAEELSKFGIKVSVYDNSVTVEKGSLSKPSRTLSGHNDHRIVMALTLLCSVTGGVIEGAEAVEKSFPDFFEIISDLGIKVEYSRI